jgi:hypothetical protein
MSDGVTTGKDMVRSLAWILAVVGVWFALQRWVLPAMGCQT